MIGQDVVQVSWQANPLLASYHGARLEPLRLYGFIDYISIHIPLKMDGSFATLSQNNT